MKNKAICFIGLDGSGKSTSVDYAYDTLKARGVKVKKVRAAYVIKVMSFFIKLGKKLVLKKDSDPYSGDYKTYLENMRKQSEKKGIYRIFTMMTTLEFKCQIFFSITLNRLFGYTLLIDRYIYDNAVTYAANLGKDTDFLRQTIEKKWKRAPKPDLIIYIKTDVETCLSRKDDIPDPLYLTLREPLYGEIANMYNATIISGDIEKEQMLSQVITAIDNI
ncbi:MAG: hypothetical protein Q4A12_03770 [Eubacteriales bacterium]|nr:hypothetical protein [Eubacteriales bacterium]